MAYIEGTKCDFGARLGKFAASEADLYSFLLEGSSYLLDGDIFWEYNVLNKWNNIFAERWEHVVGDSTYYDQDAFSGGTFFPGSPADLAMWLDGADSSTMYDDTSGGALAAPNGAIARWEDKSGNGRHATQATLSSRPMRKAGAQNGHDVLEFDGVNDFLEQLSSGLNAQQDFCFIAVHRFFDTSGNWHPVCGLKANNTGAGSGQPFLQRRSTNTQLGTHRSGISDTGTFVNPESELYSWRISLLQRTGGINGDGGTVFVRSNDLTAQSVQNWQVGVADTRLGIGDRQQNGTAFFAGSISELIALPRSLTVLEQFLIFNYLSNKWGISV